jgi:hypothetical protein
MLQDVYNRLQTVEYVLSVGGISTIRFPPVGIYQPVQQR